MQRGRIPARRTPNGNPAAVLKPSRTIASVLAQFKAPPIIDYWSLDTEGSELRILRSFPFDRHRVRVITVEHNRYPARVEIQRFLHARGYVLARDFGIDDGYVEASLAAEGSAQLRWRRAPEPLAPARDTKPVPVHTEYFIHWPEGREQIG